MKKKILPLLSLFALSPAMLAQGETETAKNDGTTGHTLADVKIEQEQYIFSNKPTVKRVFANGHRTVVSEADGYTLITVFDDAKSSQDTIHVYKDIVFLYGGSCGKDVASSDITMESGTISAIFGGGQGTDTSAKKEKEVAESNTDGDVKSGNVDNVKILLKGGTIRYNLYAGGQFVSEVKNATVDINSTAIGTVHIGGAARNYSGEFVSKEYNEYETKVGKIQLNVDGATINSLGTAGGLSYVYTQETTANIANSRIGSFYSTLSNGKTDKVTATVTNSTFNYNNTKANELCVLNRGKVGDVEFTFDGCTFNNPEDILATLGPCVSWGGPNGSGTSYYPMLESAKIVLKNTKGEAPDFQVSTGIYGADITLEGAKAVVKSFNVKSGVDSTSFNIAPGKTWNLLGGLSVAEGCSLNNSGTLNVVAPDSESLIAAVNSRASNVTLKGGETYTVSSQLEVKYPIDIVGDSENNYAIISADTTQWSGNTTQKHVVALLDPQEEGQSYTGDILLKNLILQGAKGSGIDVQTAYDVTLQNLVSRNNKEAGIIVHSAMTAKNVKTMNNGWYSVNVDEGTPNYENIVFTFDADCVFAENTKIYDETNEKNGVAAPSNWKSIVTESGAIWLPAESETSTKVMYSASNGSISIAYDDKPAASYTEIPEGVGLITITAEPALGYSLKDLKVGDGEIASGSQYDMKNASDGVLSISATFEKVSDLGEVTEGATDIQKNEAITVETSPVVVADVSAAFGPAESQEVKLVSKEMTDEEAVQKIQNAAIEESQISFEPEGVVAYDITPVLITKENGSVSDIRELSNTINGTVSIAFPYPDGTSASSLDDVALIHLNADGTIEVLKEVELESDYILVKEVSAFSPFVMVYTTKSNASVTTYYDLNLIKSEGAKLVSRHGKMRAKAGSSFTLSLEKEAGYEDCQPTVFVKRGRSGSWEALKMDEVSGYYQIRNVQSDIWVKVSGDGIWAVANENINAQEVRAYTVDGKVVVVAPQPVEVVIASMGGAVVANEQVSGQREFVNLPAGVYIVRIGEETFKLNVR